MTVKLKENAKEIAERIYKKRIAEGVYHCGTWDEFTSDLNIEEPDEFIGEVLKKDEDGDYRIIDKKTRQTYWFYPECFEEVEPQTGAWFFEQGVKESQ